MTDELDSQRRASLREIGMKLIQLADGGSEIIKATWKMQGETKKVERMDGWLDVKLTGKMRSELAVEWDEGAGHAREPDGCATVTVMHLGRTNEFRCSEVSVEIGKMFPLIVVGGPMQLKINGILKEKDSTNEGYPLPT
jgi:hypothetical protein